MKRIGYDADTGCYYFKDSDGSIWRGEAGSSYSEMTRVSSPRPSTSDDDRDLEGAGSPTRRNGYQLLPTDANKTNVNASAYRTLFPFFLLIAAVLLLVWRLVVSPNLSAAPAKLCPKPQTTSYLVQSGDTCWDISKAHHCSVDVLKELNAKVQCDKLTPGAVLCVPGVEKVKSKERVMKVAKLKKSSKK
ncbi:hypothetical protein JOM56_006812 [Amanita muscaria]